MELQGPVSYPTPVTQPEVDSEFVFSNGWTQSRNSHVTLQNKATYNRSPLSSGNWRDTRFSGRSLTTRPASNSENGVKSESITNGLHTFINNSSVCKHPNYKSFQARLSSYSGWPQTLLQRPCDLAAAGLFYTGFEDHVRCFQCDGGLKSWDPEDDPWMEHCRWFPNCEFVRKEKGDSFIALVQARSDTNQAINSQNPHNHAGEQSSSVTAESRLRDNEFKDVIQEHKAACIEMGYPERAVNTAVASLINKGILRPTIEELLDSLRNIALLVELKRENEEKERRKNESPTEENERLKKMVYCSKCGVRQTNALFLPCNHHRMCMECAESVTVCPVCNKRIRDTIKTFMV